MRNATVVLPVPGLPVKDICRLGAPAVIFNFLRTRSTSNSAAVSRMRVLTGFKPINSRSSLSSTSLILEARNSASRSTVLSEGISSSESVVMFDPQQVTKVHVMLRSVFFDLLIQRNLYKRGLKRIRLYQEADGREFNPYLRSRPAS